ncbi:hypothetical protein [Paraburkholderia tagetis]|uniref:Uncharacterized protein n=1 Tax=Paraburkholderia tagetis TaxID=2913261 RepID=A0A9X1UL89_9BURK|nr:hypothetical protein [Paraburkholderia tagetis]MCG5077438.1 hypothetical protein [Paraburkholderia tagetis]
MDKLVLSLLLSLLAGFLTAVGTFVKLVNDKESKVTEFRQEWTDSARHALANVVSQLRYFCSLATEQATLDSDFDRLVGKFPKPDQSVSVEVSLVQSILESQIKERESLRLAFRENREAIHSAYALAKLHFKPGDSEFLHVQNQIDQALSIVDGWKPRNDESSDALRAKMDLLVEGLTSQSRSILKGEWEKIKGGEPSYKQTRIWAKRGGLAGAGALAVLLCWFGVEALLNWKEASDRHAFTNTPASTSGKSDARRGSGESSPISQVSQESSCNDLALPALTVVQQNLSSSDSLPVSTSTQPTLHKRKQQYSSSACEDARGAH